MTLARSRPFRWKRLVDQRAVEERPRRVWGFPPRRTPVPVLIVRSMDGPRLWFCASCGKDDLTFADPTAYVEHVKACGAERIARLKSWQRP